MGVTKVLGKNSDFCLFSSPLTPALSRQTLPATSLHSTVETQLCCVCLEAERVLLTGLRSARPAAGAAPWLLPFTVAPHPSPQTAPGRRGREILPSMGCRFRQRRARRKCANCRSEERRVGKECISLWSPYH